MRESKLFEAENRAYKKTEKGKVYAEFLSHDFNKNEKWIINFLFLLDSFIGNRKNYLLERTKEIYEILSDNTSKDFIDKASTEFFNYIIKNPKSYEYEYMNYDFVFLNCFYLESNFLKLYYKSSEIDRSELKDYVKNNLKNGNYDCCVSKKFQPSGNYTYPEIADDIKIFIVSRFVNTLKFKSFTETIEYILNKYNLYFNIDTNKVKDFIKENSQIFESIIIDAFNLEDNLDDTEPTLEEIYDKQIDINSEIDKPEKKIDDTIITGKKQLSSIFNSRKKIAIEKSGHKCELEALNRCRYFIAKSTNKNYVEVHHFVPREFRNNYEFSIDVLSNYVTLCPHCHRMIHYATDRERVNIIRCIFNQRKERLKKCGILIDLAEVFDYYGIDNSERYE